MAADRAPADGTATRGAGFASLRLVSLCTLLSRVLGLIRDVGMAALFGNGVILDAFTVAFRIPNLARRLFGEGALTAAFLPSYVRALHQDGVPEANRLASAVLAWMTVLLGAGVVIGELLLWGLARLLPLGTEAHLLVGLTAVMLPYLVMICVAAQVSAIQHAWEHFFWPAMLPVVLNVIWIVAIWGIAPVWGDPIPQIYVISAAITAGGALQLVLPWPALRRLGFRFDRNWRGADRQVRQLGRVMVPVIVGLSITQLNTLCDSLMAWGLARPTAGTTGWLFDDPADYPLNEGSAAALYLGQRLYQFPLGIFGVALGTVLFPRFARHAEAGRMQLFRADLVLGLRLVALVGVPASVGLMLLAEPVSELLFRRGQFDAEDSMQTARAIAAYGSGVWAYCGLLIVHRGLYAVNDAASPVRIGAVTALLNLVLNVVLVWPLGGAGLAWSTAITAGLQLLLVSFVLEKRIGGIDRRLLASTIGKSVIATALMAAACAGSQHWLMESRWSDGRVLAVVVPFIAAVVVYLGAVWQMGLKDLLLLLARGRGREAAESDAST